MMETFYEIEDARDAERMFRKRDPEGRFIFNNVLINGHAHMLEYLLESWADAHANLPLTLEGNTTVLHQAFSKAAFIKSGVQKDEREVDAQAEVTEEAKFNGAAKSEKKKYEAPVISEETFITMIRLLFGVKDKLIGAGIGVDN